MANEKVTLSKRILDLADGRTERMDVYADVAYDEVMIRRGISWSLRLSKQDAIEFANAILAAAQAVR